VAITPQADFCAFAGVAPEYDRVLIAALDRPVVFQEFPLPLAAIPDALPCNREFAVRVVAITPDACHVAIDYEDLVWLLDTRTNDWSALPFEEPELISNLEFSSDGRVLGVGIGSSRVEFWDLLRRRRLLSIPANPLQGPVYSFGTDPNSFLVAEPDRSITFRTLPTGQIVRRLDVIHFAVPIEGLELAEQRITVRYVDGTVGTWNLETGGLEELTQPTATQDQKPHALLVPETPWMTAGGERVEVRPGAAESEQPAASGDWVFATTVAAGRRTAAHAPEYERGTLDAIEIVDQDTGESIRVLRDAGHKLFPSLGAAFSPDGELFALGETEHYVRLWSVSSGELLWRRYVADPPVCMLAFSQDARLLVVGLRSGCQPTLQLFDTQKGEPLGEFGGHRDGTSAALFFADDRRLVTVGDDATLRIWDVATCSLLATLVLIKAADAEKGVEWIAFTAEGYYAGTAGVKDRLLWCVEGVVTRSPELSAFYRQPTAVAINLALWQEDRP
jgi:WD40 repeat protein